MKKKIITLLILAGVFFAFAAPAGAVGEEASVSDALDLDKVESSLPESAEEIIGDLEISPAMDADKGLNAIIQKAGGLAGPILGNAVKNAAVVILIAMLASLAGTVYASSGSKVPDYTVLAGVLAVAAAAAGNMTSFAGEGVRVMDELDAFSKTLLPTLTAAATATGALTSAAAKYAATAFFMDILITVGNRVILPMIYAYIGASIGAAATGNSGLTGAANLIKWLATAMMTGITLAFTAYLLLTGVVTGTTDAAATRAAKTVVSTLLPVVGGILTDAASTVVGGLSLIKNAVGIFGLLAVLATCLAPFLRLGANYLVYKAAASITSAIADERIAKLVSAVGTAIGMMIGLAGAAALMLFFSIISVLKAVTG